MMAAIDLVVLLTVIFATCTASKLLWRRGVRRRRLLAGVWLSFYGLLLVAMMVAHSAEILYRAYTGGTTIEDSAWAYDFRTYSLHLLGAVLIWQGITVIRSVLALSAGSPVSSPQVTRAVWVTLAVVSALIPIQVFFGVLLTSLSVISLVVLAVAREEQVRVAE